MPHLTLGEILRNMLVDPSAPIEEGGAPLQTVFGINPDTVFAWEPRRIDVATVPERAYRAFHYKGMGCGYGVFYGIVSALAEQFGAPYDSFPLTVLEHKKGRFSGAGKVCGALVGADMAMALFRDAAERAPLMFELQAWYAATLLPLYVPPKGLLDGQLPVGLDMEVAQSVAGSVMCADSLGSWIKSHGVHVQDSERKERCSRVAASVAAKAVEIMNAAVKS